MSRADSQYYGDGCRDGQRDTLLASSCPPGMPLGRNPGQSWSILYNDGYDDRYNPVPCPCDGSCKRGKSYGEAPDNDAGNAPESWSGGVEIWYSGDVITP